MGWRSRALLPELRPRRRREGRSAPRLLPGAPGHGFERLPRALPPVGTRMTGERHLRSRVDMVAVGMTLEQQNDALLAKISFLKLQIDTARATAASSGRYADPDWYSRASHALRMTQREHQQVQRDIGERNRGE